MPLTGDGDSGLALLDDVVARSVGAGVPFSRILRVSVLRGGNLWVRDADGTLVGRAAGVRFGALPTLAGDADPDRFGDGWLVVLERCNRVGNCVLV